MSQFKIHRPYTYLGSKTDRSYQLALAIPLNEGETLHPAAVGRVNNSNLLQVTVTINLSNQPKGEVTLHRTNPEIIKILPGVVDGASELEVVIRFSDGTTLLRDYCNLSLADADDLGGDDLTKEELLPLLLLQQTGWANAANGTNKYLPGTVWVGTDSLEVAPGATGGFEVSLMNGKKRKPRVPTNPCPPPQGQFTGNGNNGGGDNHDNKIENLAERIVEEKEPLFESVAPRV